MSPNLPNTWWGGIPILQVGKRRLPEESQVPQSQPDEAEDTTPPRAGYWGTWGV